MKWQTWKSSIWSIYQINFIKTPGIIICSYLKAAYKEFRLVALMSQMHSQSLTSRLKMGLEPQLHSHCWCKGKRAQVEFVVMLSGYSSVLPFTVLYKGAPCLAAYYIVMCLLFQLWMNQPLTMVSKGYRRSSQGILVTLNVCQRLAKCAVYVNYKVSN